MKSGFRNRRVVGGLTVALMAGLMSAVTAGPASAFVTADGPPVVDGVAPLSGPSAGGTPVRINGSGFTGTTSVTFGGVAATSFAVIDSKLITAVTPGGTNNTYVAAAVTDADGSNSLDQAFLYTNATLVVSPNSSLAPGQAIQVTMNGYIPSAMSMVLPEFNPLQIYLEGGPDFPIPPPYSQVLTFPTNVTAAGNWSSPSVNSNNPKPLRLPNPFSGSNGTSYDPNIACPVNQTTANYLGNSASPAWPARPSYSGKCHIAIGQMGLGMMEVPLTYTSDPAPAAPVLNLSTASASRGQTVTVAAGSVNWNYNPFFGSATTPSRPGETALEINICWAGGATCSTSSSSSGAVDMTRYKTASTTQPITGVFSGATLSGSITVGTDVPSPCTTCFVRVRQTSRAGTILSQQTNLTIN